MYLQTWENMTPPHLPLALTYFMFSYLANTIESEAKKHLLNGNTGV